eukprot:GHVT01076129.1.p1 GENE.GHVT01076129.1~~GHVT01076129.1.p1  ORF type:complete len:164 (+),score=27.07 GHVT01076129.1:280-771(+)
MNFLSISFSSFFTTPFPFFVCFLVLFLNSISGECLPFASNSIDLITLSFGLRNFSSIPAGLDEMYRVLRPGGRLLCLEFCPSPSPLLAPLYDRYSFYLLPTLGKLIVGDGDSYQYLAESIRKFPNQQTLANLMHQAKFQRIQYTDLTLGVCAIHSAFKLSDSA